MNVLFHLISDPSALVLDFLRLKIIHGTTCTQRNIIFSITSNGKVFTAGWCCASVVSWCNTWFWTDFVHQSFNPVTTLTLRLCETRLSRWAVKVINNLTLSVANRRREGGSSVSRFDRFIKT